jgi:excisionase family DNA binding protein
MCELLSGQRSIMHRLSEIESLLKQRPASLKLQGQQQQVGSTVPPRLLNVKEAANQLRLRDSTLRLWIAGRKIASVHLGRRVLIPVEEIERLTSEGLIPHLRR